MGILRTDRITGLGGANAIKGSVEFTGDGSSSTSRGVSLNIADATDKADLDFGTQPQMSNAALSSIVLPRDDDREIAMRRMARQSGIGGLV